MNQSRNYQSAFLFLILANMIWGGNFVIGRVAAAHFPPITFSILRWIVAFMVLTPFMIKPLKRDIKTLLAHKWILLLLSITGIAGYNTIVYSSLHYTTSINASIVNATSPICIAILSVLILKERFSVYQAVGIGISILGIVFILTKGSIRTLLDFSFNRGDLAILIAVLAWGIYSIVIKMYSKTLPVKTTLYVTTFMGIIILSPLSFIELRNSTSTIPFNSTSLLILAYVGIFASVIAFLSWNTGVAKIGAARSGIFLNLLPVFATLFAVIFTKETLYWYQLVGGMIVICGVILSSKKSAVKEEMGIAIKT